MAATESPVCRRGEGGWPEGAEGASCFIYAETAGADWRRRSAGVSPLRLRANVWRLAGRRRDASGPAGETPALHWRRRERRRQSSTSLFVTAHIFSVPASAVLAAANPDFVACAKLGIADAVPTGSSAV